MSSRGIKSDFDIFPAWVDLGHREFKIEEFQKRWIMDPREFLIVPSTPARDPSFYKAIMGIPYTSPRVGDTAWVVRGGRARSIEIARFEDGGVVDTKGRWHHHTYLTAEGAEEADRLRRQACQKK